MSAKALVDQQAENAGLWFVAETGPEAYLQAALRKLHAAVESEHVALLLTDAHLRMNHSELIWFARDNGIEVPLDLWPEGDLDRGLVNDWVKRVRREALGT